MPKRRAVSSETLGVSRSVVSRLALAFTTELPVVAAALTPHTHGAASPPGKPQAAQPQPQPRKPGDVRLLNDGPPALHLSNHALQSVQRR